MPTSLSLFSSVGLDISIFLLEEMLLPVSLLPALLLAARVHSYALPNPAAAAVTNSAAASTVSADIADITDFSTLPSSYYDQFTEYTTYGSAELASESAAFASMTKQFYATAKPSQLAAISSYYRAESSAYAAWTSDLYQTLDSSEYAAMTSEYAQWTREEAVYATYTGTGTPFISGITNATAAADALPAQVTSNGVVRDNSAAAASSTAPPVAQQSFGPLTRSQSAPAAYGLTCLDSTASQLDNHTVEFADCTATEASICDSLNDPANLLTDQWVWSNSGGSCAMGYWLPKVGTGTAAIPSKDECQANIFDMMRRTCIPADGQDGKWNAASVNVAVVPSGDSNGQQVNMGRISYLMAGSPYPCGGQSCKMASDS